MMRGFMVLSPHNRNIRLSPSAHLLAQRRTLPSLKMYQPQLNSFQFYGFPKDWLSSQILKPISSHFPPCVKVGGCGVCLNPLEGIPLTCKSITSVLSAPINYLILSSSLSFFTTSKPTTADPIRAVTIIISWEGIRFIILPHKSSNCTLETRSFWWQKH